MILLQCDTNAPAFCFRKRGVGPLFMPIIASFSNTVHPPVNALWCLLKPLSTTIFNILFSSMQYKNRACSFREKRRLRQGRIKLQEWKKDVEFDRMGLEDEYTEYLDNQVVCHSVPIRPGRNLAVICETAAVNHRQKKMGYNAAQELYRRWQANMTKNNEDEE